MNEMQMSERIGNIDDRLIDQAEQFGKGGRGAAGFRRGKKRRVFRRLLAVAAAAALMTGGFVLGAFALNEEPEMIEIEGAGISLLLPDSWEGRYICEQSAGEIAVYQKSLYEKDETGMLFFIEKIEGSRPMDYSYPVPGYTIASVAGYTYYLGMASDVQYDPEDQKNAEEYISMYQTIGDIRIVLSDWMKENSVNRTNWEEGTVYVDLLNAWEGTLKENVVCDSETSKKISRLIERQEFCPEWADFETPPDMMLMIDGEEMWIESRTGKMNRNSDEMRGAVLSEQDRRELLSLIEAQRGQDAEKG